MPDKNLSALFIRSLTEALEADRLIKRTIRALQSKERTERFMQLCWSDLNNAMHTLEPVDRTQRHMAAQDRDLRIN
jgi:hypothetical protein